MTDPFKTIEMLARERNQMLENLTAVQERLSRFVEAARCAKALCEAQQRLDEVPSDWDNSSQTYELGTCGIALAVAVRALELGPEGTAMLTPPTGEVTERDALIASRCTLENCGHMRQLDAIVNLLGMTRGTRSVLDELRSRISVDDGEWTIGRFNRKMLKPLVGFSIAPDLLGEPTIWCIECGRDSGLHHHRCPKGPPMSAGVCQNSPAPVPGSVVGQSHISLCTGSPSGKHCVSCLRKPNGLCCSCGAKQ
jgi:hypothetical protein